MNFVIFGGTTEGRMLSHELAGLGAGIIVCVATEYGREEQGETSGISIVSGRMDAQDMFEILKRADAAMCIDATHPYAKIASENIRNAANLAGVPYKRLLRRESPLPNECVMVNSVGEAADFLKPKSGNILLTIGAKELSGFSQIAPDRLYPRVLPALESLTACEKAGIPRRNIIAMHGPFCKRLNLAIIEQFSIKYLVTKDGGAEGGCPEKVEAALEGNALPIVIRRPYEIGEDYEKILCECKEIIV